MFGNPGEASRMYIQEVSVISSFVSPKDASQTSTIQPFSQLET